MQAFPRDAFPAIATRGRLVPVYRELAADLETPMSVYLKLRGQGPSFLLESVEKAEQVGRYSILGFEPRREIVSRGRTVRVVDNGHEERHELAAGRDPLHAVAAELDRYRPVAPIEEVARRLPRFLGGAVGYFGYDLARFFERLPEPQGDELGLPDMHLLIADTVLVFDHAQHRLTAWVNVPIAPGADLDGLYDEAVARLDGIEARLQAPLPPAARLRAGVAGRHNGHSPLQAAAGRAGFEAAVQRAHEQIAAGELLYVSPSERWSRSTPARPVDVYRALRRLSPAPYMYLLELGGSPPVTLLGSSAEMLLRVEGQEVEMRPVAGRRPRGDDDAGDRALETELQNSPQERAQHALVVDRTRNDLGRVAQFGTVRVPDLMGVDRYADAMHLSSRVTGTLRPDVDAYELLRGAFPAGTASGVPRARAMEIINELEGMRRGPFGGAIGYIGFNGNVDTCIATHTIVIKGQTAYLQAGADVFADSDPARAWDETLHKVQAQAMAIEEAEMAGGTDGPGR